MYEQVKKEIQEILKTKNTLSKEESIYLIEKYGEEEIDSYLNELMDEFLKDYDNTFAIYKELIEQIEHIQKIEESKNIEVLNEYVENCEELNSIKLYLKEIEKFPVLTKAQEQKLGKKIKNGDMEARETLVNCNLKLAVSIAKKYIKEDTSFNDIIQNANEGLIKAVDKYDHTKGFKFSTYATWWIKQSVRKRIFEETRKMKISYWMKDKIEKYRILNERCLAEKERNMTDEEIKEALNLDEENLKLLKIAKEEIVSCDILVGAKQDIPLINLIEDENVNIEKKVENKMIKEKIMKILDKFNERERYILINRIGYNKENKEKTLEEIGRELKVSRERVRQIENRIKKRIRYDVGKMVEKKVI